LDAYEEYEDFILYNSEDTNDGHLRPKSMILPDSKQQTKRRWSFLKRTIQSERRQEHIHFLEDDGKLQAYLCGHHPVYFPLTKCNRIGLDFVGLILKIFPILKFQNLMST
jgi:hypothetical protein